MEREDDHHAYLELELSEGSRLTSSGLSEGTLRILALTILPYLKTAPGIICIEEPENGIHPQAIEIVLEALTGLYESQVWVATHSPVVLAHTELENVICLRLRAGDVAEAIPGRSHPRLQRWEGGIAIGSLFAAGVLA